MLSTIGHNMNGTLDAFLLTFITVTDFILITVGMTLTSAHTYVIHGKELIHIDHLLFSSRLLRVINPVVTFTHICLNLPGFPEVCDASEDHKIKCK